MLSCPSCGGILRFEPSLQRIYCDNCRSNFAPEDYPNIKVAIEEKEIKVVGMHCPSCVNAVQLSLTDVDGIDDAKADLDSGITKVTLDTDKVSDADIKEAVEEAGFNVE